MCNATYVRSTVVGQSSHLSEIVGCYVTLLYLLVLCLCPTALLTHTSSSLCCTVLVYIQDVHVINFQPFQPAAAQSLSPAAPTVVVPTSPPAAPHAPSALDGAGPVKNSSSSRSNSRGLLLRPSEQGGQQQQQQQQLTDTCTMSGDGFSSKASGCGGGGGGSPVAAVAARPARSLAQLDSSSDSSSSGSSSDSGDTQGMGLEVDFTAIVQARAQWGWGACCR